MKDFRVVVWGHEREKVSTGYEKGTDTGNGHIWCRFIVSGFPIQISLHPQLSARHGTATSISVLAFDRITASVSTPRTGEVISLSFWGESVPGLYL